MNTTPLHKRPVVIASAVALLHVGGLAALQSGLLVRAYEMVVPVEMISQIIEPPKPLPPPPAPPVPPPPEPAKVNKAVTLPPAPQPLAIADPTPAPNAPVVAPTPPAPLPPIAAPVAVAPTPAPAALPAPSPAPPAPVSEKITEPEISAEHQANEDLFRRSSLSIRLGEIGTVVLLVTVSVDGRAKDVVISKSSGYPRLDETARRAALLARFKPAMRGGIPIERKFPWSIVYSENKP